MNWYPDGRMIALARLVTPGAQLPALPFADDFNRPDGPLASLYWQTPRGSWSIVAGKAVPTDISPNASVAVVSGSNATDVDVSAVLTVTNDGSQCFGGVAARLNSLATVGYVAIAFHFLTTHVIRLGRLNGSAVSLIGASFAIGSPFTGTIRLTCIGTTITLYVDGVQRAQVTDANIAGPGGVGIVDKSGVTVFDSFAAV